MPAEVCLTYETALPVAAGSLISRLLGSQQEKWGEDCQQLMLLAVLSDYEIPWNT